MSEQQQNEYQHWQLQTGDDNVAWLCLDKADGSANVLSSAVLNELDSLLGKFEKSPPAALVIHSGKNNGFIMGADITEFSSFESEAAARDAGALGQGVINRIESLPCPSVAVINGFALGGGLELAMACDYRVALETSKKVIGLPEVQLGLHPGFGGTVRAVRIAGVRAGMQLMLTGQPISVSKAHRQGFIDRIVKNDEWRNAALALAKSGQARATAPLVDRLLSLPFLRPIIVRQLEKQVAARARRDHYPAPYAMIDLWARHGASAKTGYEAEIRSFAKLMVSETSRNLVRVFFLQNRLKSQGEKPAGKIARVHVVGAGVMGGDIAAWCALRGLEVTLQDRADEYIQPALVRASKLFSRKVRDANERAKTTDRLRADVNGDGVPDADLIIEAIFEDLDAKQSLYRDLQERMKPGAILATNTSSIPLEDLRSVLREPDRFIGLHFFNPVAKMPLVEVIRCEDTDSAALDIGYAFARAIGKFPLGCLSSPGFVVNRVLMPYMSEAMRIAQDGVPLAAIDKAATDFGMPMGPVELADTVGLDVALHVSQVLSAAFGKDVPGGLDEMIADNRLGRKSGEGFYKWVDGKAEKPDAGGADIPTDLQDRLLLPMLNESVACLDEGVVADADLLDAGVIFGTGFAPFRGGPLHYARTRGVDDIVRTLETLTATHGDRFAPHAGWSAIRE